MFRKYLTVITLILFFLGCSNEKSDIDIIKEQIEDQSKLIREQEDKILSLENDLNSDLEYTNNPTQNEIDKSYYIANLNINLNDLIKFKKSNIGNIEDYLIKKDWIFIDRNNFKDLPIKNKDFYALTFKNSFSDTEIKITVFPGYNNILLKTKNQKNFKKILKEIEANNFVLKNSDYDLGKSFDLRTPIVGDVRVIKTNAKLYSNGVMNLITNLNTYATVDDVLNDKDETFYYSNEYLCYELKLYND